MNDLLTQLNTLIANAEANQEAADNWRNLVAELRAVGYGPRITPGQIASLVPAPMAIDAIIAATQEVRTPEATKSNMPRRKLSEDDKQWIDQAVAAGNSPKQIASQFGLSLAAVNAYLNHE